MRWTSAFAPLVLAACAAPAAQRVIEPAVSDDARIATTSDHDFVRERSPVRRDEGVVEYPIHLEGRWYEFRARALGLTEAAARARDAAMPVAEAPGGFWDEVTAVEAVSIWSSLCNECHGGRRRVRDAVAMPPPRPGWGRGEGLFFGSKRPYREIFAVISGGGPERDGKPSEMPEWRDKLSREQMWALIYFLEYQSGGIEGRFPPSLYPRGPGDG